MKTYNIVTKPAIKTVVKKINIPSQKLEVDLKEYCGIKIFELRTSLKLDQISFAKNIAITRSNLCRIESGKQRMSLDILQRICESFNLKSSDILPF
jgi:DNA-binding XRE family transcriptional regulator